MPILRNQRHEAFCRAMAQGKTATEAMEAAGLKDPRNSSRLTKNDEIRQRIDELVTKIEERVVEKTALTKEWIIDRLVENTNRAMQVVQVLDRDGRPTGEYQYQGNVANKALELLGREKGMFNEAPSRDREAVLRLPDSELMEVLSQKAAQLGIDITLTQLRLGNDRR